MATARFRCSSRVDFGYHLAASCAERTRRESPLTRSSSSIVSKLESARRVGTPLKVGVPRARTHRGRATRREREPPSDAEIERGLRERAVTSARDAEVLLRWRQTVRPSEAAPGVDLDSLSEKQLERLYSGLVRLVSMDETTLAALVEHVLAGEKLGSS